MTTLVQQLVADRVLNENGMPALATSGSKLVDAFFALGAARHLTDQAILDLWLAAWGESPLATLRLAFVNRDVRGGQGERRTFRIFWKWLCEKKPEIAVRMIPNVPLFGRWDDLWINVEHTEVWEAITAFVFAALENRDKLCGKWMPREGKSHHKLAVAFREAWEMTPRRYRKLIAANTEVIESLMCDNRWSQINYNHVPSQAAVKYRKAFYKHDQLRYAAYVAALAKGVKGVKVNAGAILPHEVLEPLMHGPSLAEKQLVIGQWAALPNFVTAGMNFLCVIDVSASMTWYGGLPVRVATALGLYLAERAVGPFHNVLMTFDTNPAFYSFDAGTVVDRYNLLRRCSSVGGSTNFEAALKLVLDTAKKAKVPAQDMPQTLLVLSDMQFNDCVQKPSERALAMIDRMYAEAGYKRPNIVFWNLRYAGNLPVKYDEQGTALVSGFSPSLMTTVLKGSTPLEVLIQTLDQERYQHITLA